MKKSNTNLFATSALLLSVFGATFAQADNDTIGMSQDAITLENAVEIALKATNATPMSVERELERGEEIYNVELIQKDAKSVNVIVNTKTGESKAFNDADEAEDIRNNQLWLAYVKANPNADLLTAVKNAEKELGRYCARCIC